MQQARRAYVGVARRGYGKYLLGTAEPFPRFAVQPESTAMPPAVKVIARPIRRIYESHLSSKYWKDLRKSVYERSDYKCERCGSCHLLQVHHRTYERLGCERLDDVELLCLGCHRSHHAEERMSDHFRIAGMR